MTTLTATAPLDALDRCDRCGAQAYVRVTFGESGELLFCGHHARQHEEKLRELDANIHDETARLSEKPEVVVD